MDVSFTPASGPPLSVVRARWRGFVPSSEAFVEVAWNYEFGQVLGTVLPPIGESGEVIFRIPQDTKGEYVIIVTEYGPGDVMLARAWGRFVISEGAGIPTSVLIGLGLGFGAIVLLARKKRRKR